MVAANTFFILGEDTTSVISFTSSVHSVGERGGVDAQDSNSLMALLGRVNNTFDKAPPGCKDIGIKELRAWSKILC